MADEGIQSTRIDREDIRLKIGEITGWEVNRGQGRNTTSGVGTTALVDTQLYSSALDQRVRRRDVVCFTLSTEAVRGERRWATGAPDSNGSVSFSPAVSEAMDNPTRYEIWDGSAVHPDVIDQCIDRALTEACWYWRPTPMTLLRGGDVGDELVVSADDLYEYSSSGTKIWTGGGDITLTLEELDMPDDFTRRVIRLVGGGAGADAHIESNVIEVDPTNRPDWHIRGLVRSMGTVAGAAAGTGNGSEIKIMDKTNSAEITPADTLGTTNRAWTVIESGFTIPSTCHQIAIRLNIETAGEDGDFAWVQLMENGRTQFPLPNRVRSKRHVGPVYERLGDEYGEFRRRPWPGSLERRDAVGRGVTVTLQPAPGSRSLWYYEKVAFPKLTTTPPAATDDDNQTWSPMEWVVAGTLVEIYKFLRHRDKHEMPERWQEELTDAQTELSAIQDDYGIEGMLVEDSPKPRGSVILPV